MSIESLRLLNPLMLLYGQLGESKADARAIRESGLKAARAAAEARTDPTVAISRCFIGCAQAVDTFAEGSPGMDILKPIPASSAAISLDAAVCASDAAGDMLGEQRRVLLENAQEASDATGATAASRRA